MLPVDWWVEWSSKRPVCEALRAAFAEVCYGLVQEKIDGNKQTDPLRFPTSWNQYSKAMRQTADGVMTRKRSGERPTHIEDLPGISALIETPPAGLFPPISEWLGIAVMNLCEEARHETRGVDVAAFVDYGLLLYQRMIDHQAIPAFQSTGWGMYDESALTAVLEEYSAYSGDLSALKVALKGIAEALEVFGDVP